MTKSRKKHSEQKLLHESTAERKHQNESAAPESAVEIAGENESAAVATVGVELDATLARIIARDSASQRARVEKHGKTDTEQQGGTLSAKAQALGDAAHDQLGAGQERIMLEREERAGLQRVVGLSTELEDVTEVEYRQLRLEKVVLIGVYSGYGKNALADAENSLRELAALAETAGAQVLDGLLQRRPHPDPATYLGRGKAQELAELVRGMGADTVVADTELAPSQRRALEDVVKVKVIDRTAVILDIFSQHAKSREGKAQVELAQLEYLLPRLRGWGESMSRQAGGQVSGGAGMGSRGPGETKIELDRRRIHTRMAKLRKQIAQMAPARATKRASRRRNAVPSVAIAGYTNAGKSSLLNRLTGTQELVQNQLFATLDTAVRNAKTADGRHFTYADTVGFVRQLPHQLVEAFRSTFEEVAEADVILHVVDASHPDPAGQLRTVREVIAEVGAQDLPEIVVWNKCDLISADTRLVLHGLAPDSEFVSAKTGEGFTALAKRVAAALPLPEQEVSVVVPYTHGELVAELHERARVLAVEYLPEGTSIRAYVSAEIAAKLEPFVTDAGKAA